MPQQYFIPDARFDLLDLVDKYILFYFKKLNYLETLEINRLKHSLLLHNDQLDLDN